MAEVFVWLQTVVFALGPGSRLAHVHQLAAALEAIGGNNGRNSRQEHRQLAVTTVPLSLPRMQLTPRQAFFAQTERHAPAQCMRTMF